MTHFVLVHGGWHGEWCWTAVIDELRTAGHDASAVRLPSDEIGAGAADYAEVIAAAVEPSGSAVVGHSLAGLAIPLVPALAEVSALVYLASLLPSPGLSWRDQLARDRPMSGWFHDNALPRQHKDPLGRTSWGPELARELFFHDCPPGTARAAAARLRPQAPTPVAETTPLRRFPAVPSAYVIGRQDRAVDGAWAASAAAERLGVAPVLIDGSHSPFLSRPGALARLLVELTGPETAPEAVGSAGDSRRKEAP